MNNCYQISNSKFWNAIQDDFADNGGLYKLYCVDENKKPIKAERILKPDNKGILYIGKATKFLDRVITLKKALSPDHISDNHDCGVRYKNLNALKIKFPYEDLWVKLIGCKEIDIAEIKLLTEYENEFGELPPLNRNK